MGTRKASRADLLKLVEYVKAGWENHSKLDALGFKIYHVGCKSGRIKCPNQANLTCSKCKASWGQNRPNTWTDEEIAQKFFCEIPPDPTVYKLSVNPDGNYHQLTVAPVAKPKPKNIEKEPIPDGLKKMLDALGLRP